MVDTFNTNDPAAVPAEGAPAAGGIRGFVATRNGKLILGAALLLLVLAAVAAVLLPSLLAGPEATDGLVTVPPAGSLTTTVTGGIGSEEATPTARRAKPLSTIFVFRDIFEPTVNPALPTVPGLDGGVGSGSGGNTASGTADTPDLPADTLFLRSVDTVDGEPVATFIWNGTTYTAGEGESLEGTPWRVVSISGNTVVLLYGDSRVILTVGQGMTK